MKLVSWAFDDSMEQFVGTSSTTANSTFAFAYQPYRLYVVIVAVRYDPLCLPALPAVLAEIETIGGDSGEADQVLHVIEGPHE